MFTPLQDVIISMEPAEIISTATLLDAVTTEGIFQS